MDQDLYKGESPVLSRRILLAALGIGSLAFLGLDYAVPVNAAELSSSTITEIPDYNDKQLMLLKNYEHQTDVAPRMMKFIGFPENNQDAVLSAETMAGVLTQWQTKGVKPVVIMEPTFNSSNNGQQNMDLSAFSKGSYDSALNTYFNTLKKLGITSSDMGSWVLFPEPNDPGWANDTTSPQLFAQNYTKVASLIKSIFPRAETSIMLDSQTSHKQDYSDATTSFKNGLLTYLTSFSNVKGYHKGLIDSFGFQGFSWDNSDTATDFLSSSAVISSAKQLGIKHAWFNTGTFSVSNNPNTSGLVYATNQRRAQVLDEVLAQALKVKKAGVQVDFINVFGQNVFDPNTAGTANFQYSTPQALEVLKGFVEQAKSNNIPVAIFDSPK